MTLDEAILHAEEVAEENQSIVDGCDYFGENMAKCEKCAAEHRQLAEWLKELKQLREQEPCEDAVSRRVVKEQMIKYGFLAPDMTVTEFVEDLPSVQPMRKQEPKSEWEQDHEILKAYSDGANEMLDKIKEDIRRFMFEVNPSSSESDYACNYILDVIDKYNGESEG